MKTSEFIFFGGRGVEKWRTRFLKVFVCFISRRLIHVVGRTVSEWDCSAPIFIIWNSGGNFASSNTIGVFDLENYIYVISYRSLSVNLIDWTEKLVLEDAFTTIRFGKWFFFCDRISPSRKYSFVLYINV